MTGVPIKEIQIETHVQGGHQVNVDGHLQAKEEKAGMGPFLTGHRRNPSCDLLVLDFLASRIIRH